ncbi:IS3 family transposase [Cytobacillus horneckiae]|uniref:IS3 family transposase n=1 Tax=Cytobacillus horneckiae TaxID=549687 RepID=UPI003D1A4DA2
MLAYTQFRFQLHNLRPFFAYLHSSLISVTQKRKYIHYYNNNRMKQKLKGLSQV